MTLFPLCLFLLWYRNQETTAKKSQYFLSFLQSPNSLLWTNWTLFQVSEHVWLKETTPNGRIISQHPACFECLASGEIQNINNFNQIGRFLSVTQQRVKKYLLSSWPLFHLFYLKKKPLFQKLALFSFTGRWDKNKFLSCLATRGFILGPNRSPLFCPPEKVNRASVQTTILSILKIWKLSLQYNLPRKGQSVNMNTMSPSVTIKHHDINNFTFAGAGILSWYHTRQR